MTEADFFRLVLPFLAGLVLGVWLKKPVEFLLTLGVVGVGIWGFFHQEEAEHLLTDLTTKGVLWLEYGVREATVWASGVLSGRVDPWGLLAWLKTVESKWLFVAGFLGGLRA